MNNIFIVQVYETSGTFLQGLANPGGKMLWGRELIFAGDLCCILQAGWAPFNQNKW